MMSKRTSRAAWGLALLLTLAGPSALAESSRRGVFDDIAADQRAFQAVEVLAQQGILAGFRDSLFHGERVLTRYEAAIALQRLTQLPYRLDFPRARPTVNPRVDLPVLSAPFRDVTARDWASDAVEWLREKGIVAGYPDGTYRGGQPMRREEMAVIIPRLRGFFVGGLGHDPQHHGLLPRIAAPGGREQSLMRCEFAVVLHQVLDLYQAVAVATTE